LGTGLAESSAQTASSMRSHDHAKRTGSSRGQRLMVGQRRVPQEHGKHSKHGQTLESRSATAAGEPLFSAVEGGDPLTSPQQRSRVSHTSPDKHKHKRSAESVPQFPVLIRPAWPKRGRSDRHAQSRPRTGPGQAHDRRCKTRSWANHGAVPELMGWLEPAAQRRVCNGVRNTHKAPVELQTQAPPGLTHSQAAAWPRRSWATRPQ
jgi:hypothetical protein